jgi:hypothetical protein
VADSVLSVFPVLTQVSIRRAIKMQNVSEHSQAIILEQRKVIMKTQILCLRGRMTSPWFRERNKESE